MTNTKFRENEYCKADLIRTVYEKNPHMKNREIIEQVRKIWGVNVSSQMVIHGVGRQRNRIDYTGRTDLLNEAKKYLNVFGSDLQWAFYWLKRAAA